MDNEWPPLETCPQFIYGMLQPYLRKFVWEEDEADETQYESVYDDDESDDEDVVPRKFAFKPSLIKKFLHQVRTTRGYDVDVDGRVPYFMGSPFRWASLTNEYIAEWVNFGVEISIEHINSKTGKFYKHINTLNVVDTPSYNYLFLTFTAGAIAKENPEECQKKVSAAAVHPEETFLATVYSPNPSCRELYELLECFLKPQGPAPWKYLGLPSVEHPAP